MNPSEFLLRLRMAVAEHALHALLAASVVLPLLILSVVAWHDYGTTVARASERVDRTSRIAREHALKVFETNDMILRRVQDLIGTDRDDALLARKDEIERKLAAIAAGVPQLRSISIWSAEGHPIASSRPQVVRSDVSIADRDYFRAAQMQDEPLVISDTLRGRASGEVLFVMSHRRDDAEGRFAGTVSIALDPGYFTRFYEQLAAQDPALSIALTRPDGSVITRFPDPPQPDVRVTADNPLVPLIDSGGETGVSVAVSPEDGQRRFVTAQRVGAYPLLASVGLLHSAVIGDWLRRLWLPAGAALATVAALVLLAGLTLRNARREKAAIAQWQAEAARRAAAERALAHLSQHLIRLSENEKAKLAAELHDELGGALSALSLDISWVLERLKKQAPELVDRQKQALKLVQDTAVLKRRIIDGLRPMLLQHLGLVPALSDYVRQWSAKSGTTVSLQLAPEIPQLEPDAALALFRVVQESLTNVAKYAHAKSVTVQLREEAGTIAVTVIDDGTGIAPERLAHPTSHGIAGMQQRMAQFGGSFAVESTAGRGTRIRAAIPLANAGHELASAAA